MYIPQLVSEHLSESCVQEKRLHHAAVGRYAVLLSPGRATVRPKISLVIGWLKRLLPLPRQARVADGVLPARQWFRFALWISRWQGRLVAARGGNRALTQALMLDHWLRELTRCGPFPVPWRLDGRDVVERVAASGPVLFCWTHLPLSEMPLRPYMELGYEPPVVVADPGRILDGDHVVVCGMAKGAPAVPATIHVFARIRNLFLQGRSVVCLADSDFAAPLSANPLRLAAKMRVPVVFQWSEIGPDGVVDVTFRDAPHPMCETEEEIAENLNFLRAANYRVLRSLGVEPPPPVEPAVPPLELEASDVPAIASASSEGMPRG